MTLIQRPYSVWLTAISLSFLMLRADSNAPTMTPFELGYSVRSWTMDDGLLGPYIAALMQGSDGALTFSDGESIMRYNGIEFAPITESIATEIPTKQTLRLFEDSRGRLWSSGLQGQAVRGVDGVFQKIGQELGGRIGVGAFAEGPDGRLWSAVCQADGPLMISYYENGRFLPALDKEVATGYARSMAVTQENQVWLTTVSNAAGGPLFRLEERGLVSQPVEGSLATLFQSKKDPRIWLATQKGSFVLTNGTWTLSRTFDPPLPSVGGINACEEDANGNLWIATRRQGLWVSMPDGQLRKVSSPIIKIPNFVRDLFIGRDGTLWLSGENGLLQFHRQPFTLWPASTKNLRSTVRAMCQDAEGTMWFASDGLYSLPKDGFVREHLGTDGLSFNTYSLTGYQDSGAWFMGWDGPLNRVSAQGMPLSLGIPASNGSFVRDLVQCKGEVWVCQERGLMRLEGGRLLPSNPDEALLDRALSIAVDQDEHLYVGFDSEGLFRRTGQSWQHLGVRGAIEKITISPDSTPWIRRGPDQLGWMHQGQWYFMPGNALGLTDGFSMLCTRSGDIWFQMAKGSVLRFKRKTVEAWMKGDRSMALRPKRYGRTEGLASETSPEGVMAKTMLEDSEGRVWIATAQGACVFDPSREPGGSSVEDKKKATPMPVLIEKVIVDDSLIEKPYKEIVMQPDNHRLEIHFAGIDLSSPKSVRYRYRLIGMDTQWIDIENRHTVYFQNLPPGSYEFQVTGADRNGIWNQRGAVIGLQVQPHWWERPWIRYGGPSLCLTAAAGLLMYRTRRVRLRAMRIVQMRQNFSRGLIEAQEAERTRIAGELHDDLGQDLLVIKSRIDMARRKVTRHEDQEVMERLSESTAAIMKKVRSLSHELRPFHLDHLGLASSIRKLAKDLSEASHIAFETEVEDFHGALSKDSEVAIYRIIQESINNAVKHANAQKMKIELKRHEHYLTLTITDNGDGFIVAKDLEESDKIGQGLRTMKERCRLIGGQFHVNSNQGTGTLIRIEAPLDGRKSS